MAEGRPIRLQFAVATKLKNPDVQVYEVAADPQQIERMKRIVERVREGIERQIALLPRLCDGRVKGCHPYREVIFRLILGAATRSGLFFTSRNGSTAARLRRVGGDQLIVHENITRHAALNLREICMGMAMCSNLRGPAGITSCVRMELPNRCEYCGRGTVCVHQ